MPGMTDKDKKEVSKMIKEIMGQALNHSRQIDEILKLTSQDKEMSVLAKAMADTHKPFHKAGRALLDAMK